MKWFLSPVLSGPGHEICLALWRDGEEGLLTYKTRQITIYSLICVFTVAIRRRASRHSWASFMGIMCFEFIFCLYKY